MSACNGLIQLLVPCLSAARCRSRGRSPSSGDVAIAACAEFLCNECRFGTAIPQPLVKLVQDCWSPSFEDRPEVRAENTNPAAAVATSFPLCVLDTTSGARLTPACNAKAMHEFAFNASSLSATSYAHELTRLTPVNCTHPLSLLMNSFPSSSNGWRRC